MQNNTAITATVWLIDSRTVSENELARAFVWLNADEVARYHRFVRPQRQHQFLVGRLLLRLALGEVCGVRADSILLTEQVNNAPLLNWPTPIPGFSLSHSGSWVACAISANSVLGLDIEMLDPSRDWLKLSEQIFEPDEIAVLDRCSDEKKLVAFYELWSTKEAKYKLASNAGELKEINCVRLSHPSVSMVLCSSYAFDSMPQIIESNLSEMFAKQNKR